MARGVRPRPGGSRRVAGSNPTDDAAKKRVKSQKKIQEKDEEKQKKNFTKSFKSIRSFSVERRSFYSINPCVLFAVKM